MKAIFQESYGAPEVLKVGEIERPKPGDTEIQIKLEYANVASGDARVRALNAPFPFPFIMRLIFGWNGLRRKVPGVSGAGTVTAVGKDVEDFKVGDKVYAINGMKQGYYSEYVTEKAYRCVDHVPSTMTTKEAAPLAFGALTAFHFTNEKNIPKGADVLIYGASGSVGTYAVQLAKYYGATVTAVSSKKNHELLQSLGADHVIDYKANDFRETTKKYDVIFDAVGKISKSSCKKNLKPKAKFLSVKAMTSESHKLLHQLRPILESGKLKSVISEEFKFEDVVEAHRLVDSGRKVGNIVLKIN